MSVGIKLAVILLAGILLIMFVGAVCAPVKRKPGITPDPNDAINLERSRIAKRSKRFQERLYEQLDQQDKARNAVPATVRHLRASSLRLAQLMEVYS